MCLADNLFRKKYLHNIIDKKKNDKNIPPDVLDCANNIYILETLARREIKSQRYGRFIRKISDGLLAISVIAAFVGTCRDLISHVFPGLGIWAAVFIPISFILRYLAKILAKFTVMDEQDERICKIADDLGERLVPALLDQSIVDTKGGCKACSIKINGNKRRLEEILRKNIDVAYRPFTRIELDRLSDNLDKFKQDWIETKILRLEGAMVLEQNKKNSQTIRRSIGHPLIKARWNTGKKKRKEV